MSPETNMKTLRLLNVEDSEDDSSLIIRHLRRGGFDVQMERVETAETMRAALAAQEWDVIISDFRMPVFGGLEALQVLKESGLNIPFIVISGTIGEETAVKAMLAGVSDYLMKSSLARLIPAIERELQEAANRRAHRQAEKNLQESEKRLQLALSAAGMGVWEWNLQTNEVYWSPECFEIIRSENFDHTLQGFVNLLHPEDVSVFMEAAQDAANNNKHFEVDFRTIDPQGEIVWLANFGLAEYDTDGKSVRLIGTVQDITERKKAETALRESEEKFRALVQATTQYVWTTETDQKPNELPEWWGDLTGQTPEESQGWGWINRLHTDDRESVKGVWREAFEQKTVFNYVFRVLTRQNEYNYFVCRGVPICNEDGTIRRWVGTLNDITEKKLAEVELVKKEEQLQQAQKLESIGRLAGGIAHDFNNMLTVINGYSDLALRGLSHDDPLRRKIGEIKTAGERAAELTNQLLAFSRRQLLKTKVLDVNPIISNTTLMLQRLIGEDIQLVEDLSPDISKIEADSGQLSQILMNLIINSRDAMPQGGNITIKTENVYLNEEFVDHNIGANVGDHILLKIADTGTGMEEEIKNHIFEPFFTTKDVGRGTGLGLSTVYGIVNQFGGYISVESAVGVGTTFDIYLPAFEESVDNTENQRTTINFTHGTETILLVEDEELVRKLSQQFLETAGYKVIEAENGAQAIAICEQMNNEIDMLITDVVMPEMSGRELADKLSEICPRVLFTSGYTDDAVMRHGITNVNFNFLQKPFTFDELTQKVREVLDSSSEK